MPSLTAPPRAGATPEQVGEHVAAEAAALQARARKNVAPAVAALARLRRSVGTVPGERLDILVHTYHPAFAPAVDTGDAETPTDAENAAHLALALFAVHQQSQSQPMHRAGRGLGTALRALGGETVKENDPLLRRFRALGTSDTFSELTYHLRGAAQLLRQGKQPTDYGLLAVQLVRWQRFPDGPTSVRLRWGREFHRTHKTTGNPEIEGTDQ